jgi:hypothetical protein
MLKFPQPPTKNPHPPTFPKEIYRFIYHGGNIWMNHGYPSSGPLAVLAIWHDPDRNHRIRQVGF